MKITNNIKANHPHLNNLVASNPERASFASFSRIEQCSASNRQSPFYIRIWNAVVECFKKIFCCFLKKESEKDPESAPLIPDGKKPVIQMPVTQPIQQPLAQPSLPNPPPAKIPTHLPFTGATQEPSGTATAPIEENKADDPDENGDDYDDRSFFAKDAPEPVPVKSPQNIHFLEKTEEQITKEFAILEKFSPTLKPESRPDLFAVGHKHNKSNRYINILPNEPTRFKIAEEPDFYINANWILNGRAIATSGPLPHTIEDFWKMVWHSKAATIGMLTNFIEKKADKCAPYWLDQQAKPLEFPKSKITLTLLTTRIVTVECYNLGLKKVEHYNISIRSFSLTYGKEQRFIELKHLENWPDFGVVPASVLCEFISEMRSSAKNGPFVLHCSAGVGRTGAAATTLETFNQIDAGNYDPDLIYKVASFNRDQETGRNGMIQTADQYKLIYDAVNHYLKKKFSKQ